MSHEWPRSYRSPRGGFTLVEMLVVVAIVTVLVAMLLPALARARDHAKRTKCAANLRAIGQAMMMYAQLYRAYPGTRFAQVEAEAAIWPARLRPLAGGSRDMFHCPARDEQFRWDQGSPQPVVTASRYFLHLGYDVGEPLIHLWTHFSYGYNINGAGLSGLPPDQKGLGIEARIPDLRQDFTAGDMPMSRVKRPAEMIAVADSDGNGFSDYIIEPRDNSLPGGVHGGGANVLFCDGHVAWYPQTDLVVHYPFRVDEAPIIRMWNNDHSAPWDYAGGSGKSP
jgi:prepilin-type processing-associated H-X9-DG protein/prepilin-type N-terminal cleavage/methylation domain-containing protein